MKQRNDRRQFLKSSAILGGASAVGVRTPPSHAQTWLNQGVQKYRTLGRTNLKVSDISFGSSRLRSGEENLVHHAIDLGINYFDTAESYTAGQSETVIGRAIKGQRTQLYLVSKTIIRATTSADDMMRDLEGSLRRLQTDYIDVYMNHAVTTSR